MPAPPWRVADSLAMRLGLVRRGRTSGPSPAWSLLPCVDRAGLWRAYWSWRACLKRLR
jgi:hypothetical protein